MFSTMHTVMNASPRHTTICHRPGRLVGLDSNPTHAICKWTMAQTTITSTLLKNTLVTPGKRYIRVCDELCRGFMAEIRPTGTTFWLRYYDERHRPQHVRIGRLGEITVSQARKRAEELRANISLGGDPAADKRKRLAVPLVSDFLRERFIPHTRERLSSHANIEVYVRRITAALGHKALNEVSPSDVDNFRRVLVAQKLANATVNRHLATLRRAFNLALRWQLFTGTNPAASPGMLTEQSRQLYLKPVEVQALLRALDLEPQKDAATALVLLLLTGARRSEIALARWENVDLDHGVVTVPRNKAGRRHTIPLSAPALSLFRVQRRGNLQGRGLVLPGATSGSLRGAWARAKKRAGLRDDLHIHDLRHTFASTLVNAGVSLPVIGTLLGHSQLSTTAIYAHHAPERLMETATIAAQAWNLLPAQQARMS